MPSYAIVGGQGGQKVIIPDDKVSADFGVHIDNFNLAAENLEVIATNLESVADTDRQEQIDGMFISGGF